MNGVSIPNRVLKCKKLFAKVGSIGHRGSYERATPALALEKRRRVWCVHLLSLLPIPAADVPRDNKKGRQPLDRRPFVRVAGATGSGEFYRLIFFKSIVSVWRKLKVSASPINSSPLKIAPGADGRHGATNIHMIRKICAIAINIAPALFRFHALDGTERASRTATIMDATATAAFSKTNVRLTINTILNNEFS